MKEIHDAIIKLFKSKDTPPDDSQVHDLADKMGINPHEFEGHIYMILHSYIKTIIGRHNDIPDEQFDPEELKMGIKVEMEHTDNINLSKRITKDHLSEITDYYTRLNKMESEADIKHESDYSRLLKRLRNYSWRDI
ncbi:MAG: hypothetical protein KAS32_08455 [Candidatus Peribacteraceae bacterium]|nr:hypothetical protein [Candidatus Peribacteraceae bacterium]